jgi:hypothetical protein
LGIGLIGFRLHVAGFFIWSNQMTFTFNKSTGKYINNKGEAITADDVFDLADNESASFADYLMSLGIADRATARPLVMKWAAKKYKVAIEQGQRGAKLPRNSGAEKAMNRVLQVCFPSADLPQRAPAKSNKTDNVAKLLKAYTALTAAERKRFLAAL